MGARAASVAVDHFHRPNTVPEAMSKLGGDPFDAAYAAIVAGDEPRAVAMFRASLARWPKARPIAWVTLGAILRRHGELDEAIECLVKATELCPLRDRFAAVLCKTLHELGRRDEARVEAERFMRLVREGRAECGLLNQYVFDRCGAA